jgi:uncharacterized protein YndB with AHSA1/START domain
VNRHIITECATIDAPVERVWEAIRRTDRYAEWVVGVVIEVTGHQGASQPWA